MPYNWRKGVKIYWVKKEIGSKEWKDVYSQNSSYHKLGVEGIGRGKRIIVGFCVANEIPPDCELLNEQELLEVYAQRQATNTKPLPTIQRSENNNPNLNYESFNQYSKSS